MMDTILFLWGVVSAFLIFGQRSKINRLARDFERFKVEAGDAYRRLRDSIADPKTGVPPHKASDPVKTGPVAANPTSPKASALDAGPPKPVVPIQPAPDSPAPESLAAPFAAPLPPVLPLAKPLDIAGPQAVPPAAPAEPAPVYAAKQAATPSISKPADTSNIKPPLISPAPQAKPAVASPALPPKPVQPVVPPVKAKPVTSRALSIDRFMSGNWLVWIGGIALALGGGFLVKVSYDAGFFGPAVRIIGAGILATLLVVAAEFLRRRPLAKAFGPVGADSAPAILAGAGLFIGYADVFAAYSLYGFIGATTAFAVLAAIAFLALALSPRHGKPIGLLGLLGAFVVPLLVSSKTPQLIPLYVFLGAVAGASVGVFRAQRWWGLTGVALAGSLAWGLMGTLFTAGKFKSAPDAMWASGLFLIFIAVIFCLRWQPNRKPLADVPQYKPSTRAVPSAWWSGPRDIIDSISLLAAIGTALIMHVLVSLSHYQPIALWLGGALLVLMMLRASTRLGLDILSSLAMTLLLSVLYFWATGQAGGFTADTKIWALVLTLGIGGGAGLMMLLAPTRAVPAQWAIGATASLAAAYVMGFGFLGEAQQTPVWAGIGSAVAALPFMALARLRKTGQQLLAQNVYAGGVFALLAFALVILFERNALTLALALFVTLVAVVYGHLRLSILQWIAGGLALFVLGRLGFNSSLVTQSVQPPVLNWLLPVYGGAALAFLAAHRLFRKSGGTPMLLNLLEAAGIGLTVMLVSMNIRSFVATDNSLTGNYGFTEQAMQSIAWLGFSLGLGAVRRQNVSVIVIAARWGLYAAALINIVLFPVLVSSPLFTRLDIGTLPVLNLLALGLLIPGILLLVMMLFAERRNDTLYGKSAGIFGTALIILWSALELRHWFQGAQITLMQNTTLMESFAYPVLFLLWTYGLYVAKFTQTRFHVRALGYVMFLAGTAWIAFGNMLALSPLFQATQIGSLPVINLLALGFAVPGLVYLGIMLAAEKRSDRLFAKAASLPGAALVIFWSALELRHWFQGQEIAIFANTSLLESFCYPILFLLWGLGMYSAKPVQARPVLKWLGLGMFALGALWIGFGNLLSLSPIFQATEIGSLLLVNILVAGYAVPGLIGLLIMALAEKRSDTMIAKLASVSATGLLIFWSALEMRHWFQGPLVDLSQPLGAAEAYSYPVLFLLWSLALRYLKQANARLEMRMIGYAMLAASGAWVVLGNMLAFSPLLQKWSVGAWPVVNLLALAYLVPAAGLAARIIFIDKQLPKILRTAAIASIGLLVFLWCNLTLRHAFQGPVLTLGRPYAATEYYGYSLLWLVMAAGIFAAAMRWRHKWIEYAFIGLTLMTIVKVFLFDMSELSGVLRAVSFIGLGLSLMGLGLLYRRFIYRRGLAEPEPAPIAETTSS